MNNNRNISTFSPFITFCQHVIPLAYDESMSYYETLCALRDYLVNTVIPAVNNNADAVTELQKAFETLQNYVDNYFTDLNIQNEINNKLDQMADDGTLANIINQDIFTDLNNKITELENDNTTIKNDITSLENKDTELENKDNELESDIQSNTNSINQINSKINEIKNCLVIGDSWTSDSAAGRNLRSGAESWVNTFKKIFNKNFINVSENAAGFVNVGDETALSTFVTQYTTYINLETTNKDLLDTIIIFGGQNDVYNNKSLTDIKAAIDNLATAINENTPHAKVYLAYGNMQNLVTTNNYRSLINAVLEYASTTYNWTCTNASGWLIGGSTNLYANQSHQNAEGNKRIISMMNTFLFGGDGISVPVTVSNFKVNNQSVSDYTFSQNQIIYKPFQGLLQGTLYWTFTTGTYNQMTAGGHLYCTFDTDLKGGSDYDKFLPSIMYAATDGNQESLVGRCSLTNYNNNNVYKVNMGCYNAATNNQALVVTSITFNVSLII